MHPLTCPAARTRSQIGVSPRHSAPDRPSLPLPWQSVVPRAAGALSVRLPQPASASAPHAATTCPQMHLVLTATPCDELSVRACGARDLPPAALSVDASALTARERGGALRSAVTLTVPHAPSAQAPLELRPLAPPARSRDLTDEGKMSVAAAPVTVPLVRAPVPVRVAIGTPGAAAAVAEAEVVLRGQVLQLGAQQVRGA